MLEGIFVHSVVFKTWQTLAAVVGEAVPESLFITPSSIWLVPHMTSNTLGVVSLLWSFDGGRIQLTPAVYPISACDSFRGVSLTIKPFSTLPVFEDNLLSCSTFLSPPKYNLCYPHRNRQWLGPDHVSVHLSDICLYLQPFKGIHWTQESSSGEDQKSLKAENLNHLLSERPNYIHQDSAGVENIKNKNFQGV